MTLASRKSSGVHGEGQSTRPHTAQNMKHKEIDSCRVLVSIRSVKGIKARCPQLPPSTPRTKKSHRGHGNLHGTKYISHLAFATRTVSAPPWPRANRRRQPTCLKARHYKQYWAKSRQTRPSRQRQSAETVKSARMHVRMYLEIGEQEARVLILREHHEVPAISPHRQDEHRAGGERSKRVHTQDQGQRQHAQRGTEGGSKLEALRFALLCFALLCFLERWRFRNGELMN